MRQKCLLEIDKLKIEMQIEADVPAATASVKDVRSSPRKYTKKEK